MNERKETPQERYKAKNVKQYKFECTKTQESDMINKLDNEPNKSGYIKRLIRQDILKEQNEP